MKGKHKMTKYEVVKTNTGKFRIKAIYNEWLSCLVGGDKSKKYCFSNKDNAQKVCDEFNAAELKDMEKDLQDFYKTI
jgi:hypothetical protein